MSPDLRIPNYLSSSARPLHSVLLGWPTATIPALFLAIVAGTLVASEVQPNFDKLGTGMAVFFSLVVFAPAVETLIMGIVLEILLKFVRPGMAIGLSALGWAIAHSLQAPAWGLVIWWPFLIFSTLWVTFRERGYWWAWLVPASVHALNNLGPTLLLLQGR